jgi:hypothetical protein
MGTKVWLYLGIGIRGGAKFTLLQLYLHAYWIGAGQREER